MRWVRWVLLLVLFSAFTSLRAQQSLIETIVGTSGSGVAGREFSFSSVSGLAADPLGNIYFSVQSLGQVFRLGIDGRVTPYAGNGVHSKNSEHVLAVSTPLLGPSSLATDSAGNLFIATFNGLLRVDQDGMLSTVLPQHYRQPGTKNSLSVGAFAVGPDGLLYICDGSDQRIKTYSPASGTVNILAGNGERGPAQPGRIATESPLKYPQSIAVARDGAVYFADIEPAVFRIDPGSGMLKALSIRLKNESAPGDYDIPGQIALDSSGRLFVSQPNRSRVLVINLKSERVSVYAGTGRQQFNGDEIQAEKANVTMPRYITLDSSGNLIVAEDCRLRRVDASSKVIDTVAGNGLPAANTERISALEGRLWEPANVLASADGNIYITSSFSQRLLVVDSQGNLTTAAGGGAPAIGSEPGLAMRVSLNYPQGIWSDDAGHIYFSDYDNQIVRQLSLAGRTVMNFAKTPRNYNSAGVYLYHAGALVADANYFYLSDPTDHHVWRISRSDGVVTAYAGSSSVDLKAKAAEPEQAEPAKLTSPSGLALDSSGNLFIADGDLLDRKQGRILRVDAADGSMTAVLSNLQQPSGLAFASPGVLCFAEAGANRVSCLDLGKGTTKVVAGTGVGGFSGDGGPAECAQLNRPSGISFDPLGNLYIADTGNQRIRRVRLGRVAAQCGQKRSAGN